MFGELLAHEATHYLGVYHPVERALDRWDALDDTPACGSRRECEDALADNLMFPYPVCTMSSCVAAELLTDDQVGVALRYTGAW